MVVFLGAIIREKLTIWSEIVRFSVDEVGSRLGYWTLEQCNIIIWTYGGELNVVASNNFC